MPKNSHLTADKPRVDRSHAAPVVDAIGSPLPQAYEGLYAKLVNSLDGIVWEADASTFQFTFVSPQAETILGYPVEQWLNEPAFWRDHTHPDDTDWCVNFCLTATAKHEDHEFKYRMIAADGRVVWLHDIVSVKVEADDSVRLRGIMIDITERKLADEASVESEARFRATFEKSGTGMALVDMGHRARQCNPALLEMLGFTSEEMASRPFGSFAHAEDQHLDVALYDELVAGTRDKYEIEKRFVTKSGTVIWGHLIVTLIKDSDGIPRYAIDMLQDITERKQAELELRRVSERLQLATRAANIGIWDWDVVRDELVWDEAMYGLFGGRKVDFNNANEVWAGSLVPEDREAVEAQVQATLRGEREFDAEFRNVWPDGSIHYLKAASETFRDEAGNPVRMVGVNYDVTERKLAEAELRWGEEKLRLLLDSTAEGIFGVNLEGRCIFCNVSALRTLGYSDESQVLDREMHVLVAHSRADGTPYPVDECPAVQSLRTASRAFADKDVFWRSDGTCFPVEYRSYPIYREGKHIGAVVTFGDVTERKKAAESLRASEERFAKAFHASPEPISIFRDNDGVLLEVNERWTANYGYTRQEAVGSTSLELTMLGAEGRNLLRSLLDHGEPLRDLEVDLRTKTGSIRRVGLTSERIVIDGELCNIFLHRDVTDRNRAEAENRKLIHDLGERVKELTALHETARILQDDTQNVTELLGKIVQWLPPSWQYPEVTAGRISYGTKEFQTPNFAPSPWSIQSSFTAAGIEGAIEVVYLEERPAEAFGPFLEEERALLESLAEMLSSALNRQHAQRALIESEERIRQLTDNVREVLWLATPDLNHILYVSPAYEMMSGRTVASLYQQPHSFLDSVHPDDRSLVADSLTRGNDGPFEIEYRVIKQDGSLAWMWGRRFPIHNDAGEVYRIAGVVEDITERKLAEERLQTSSHQLRALSEGLRRAKEEEGIRIARELHDELGSALTSLKWSLLSLDKVPTGSLSRPPDSVRRSKIEEMVALVDATINTVRRISSELRPTVLDDLGLISAIEWHAQQFETNTRIVCRCESLIDQVDLSREQSTAVFRIFQEAMTNILRHAEATKISIVIEGDEHEFVLEIGDNGRGITETERLGLQSLGLLGMRERAHSIDGKIEFIAAPGKGTRVIVRVPVRTDCVPERIPTDPGAAGGAYH